MTKSDHDTVFMRQALDLAARGIGRTSPNPMVGSVVVRDGVVLGEGYYREYGGPHAEPQALEEAGGRAQGAVLYVTLEPCCHQGSTPPCTDAIIASGIAHVHVAMSDPDRRVSGKGIERLRTAGMTVETGLLEAEARELNAAYVRHRETGQSFVLLKLAQTLDGRIATRNGHSKWITGEAARKRVHLMRSRADAVLVGIDTVLADDPRLTVRHVDGRQPRRVVLDSRARTPLDARVLNGEAPATVCVTEAAPADRIDGLKDAGAEVLVLPGGDGSIPIDPLKSALGQAGIVTLMVEGGSRVAASFLRERAVDRIACFVAPRILGAGIPSIADLALDDLSKAIQLNDTKVEQLDDDLLVTGTPGYA
ncbi:MAG: bifunctional diaminohydroxyphosphoribosylaminopyrimidine deaminase/5-amino-6-(5-phosphoribosylamino)uracil reductase RibD [Gemmatimonadetes bacterium]|nr:bifunctional diaminohydroxyphosphoribosylaminopyrimidine deaminase/5-amino-6-(5-phosphoribosylamino)uracil reductase RibD [Gemmatimonadota bacterium]MYG84207.1 bifunctional diaminohydroxyphosphoribosylaminopyrimidine deaminase/5-amino-6-(5-phosphoribosylamino)uracil reductase RibD [Gemmatimonadota bacterium]MYJ88296.1 bifunctional diaminohydroxyphosphoribosylaminopyrimidine deaminase/5-amino-6-(5-phosphoribosylamino)uracil reductase RibD [Gemmatimonadota bacterium]